MNKKTNADASNKYTNDATMHHDAFVLASASSRSLSLPITQRIGAKTRARPLLETKPTNIVDTCNLMQQTNSINVRKKDTTINNNI